MAQCVSRLVSLQSRYRFRNAHFQPRNTSSSSVCGRIYCWWVCCLLCWFLTADVAGHMAGGACTNQPQL